MHEDPHVIDHLLWGVLELNFTSAAREIFCNTGRSQGLEVWRKIDALIYPKTLRRQGELFTTIHHPKAPRQPRTLAKWPEHLKNWIRTSAFTVVYTECR